MQNPGPGKYNDVNQEVTKNKAPLWGYKKDKYIDVRTSKLPKLNDVAPGTYNADQSFKNTVYEKNNKFFNVGKSKNKCFVDKYAQNKNWVPSPAAYATNLDIAYSKLSRSPVATRKGRH